jgi:predicted branched-subunit amino acid permease
VLAGGGAVAAVLAGLVLNARMLPYGFAVADAVDGSWWSRLIGAHLIVDESVAFALRQSGRPERRAAFWVSGIALFACWNAGVAVGAQLGAVMRDTSAFGLDAALPTVLLALVLPSLADPVTRNAALVGVVVAVGATPFLPAGVPVLLALAGLGVILARPGQGGGAADVSGAGEIGGARAEAH